MIVGMGKKKQHRREPTAPPGDPGSGPPPAQRAAGTSMATSIVAAACGSAATAVVVTGPGHLAHAAFELGVRAMPTVSVAATVVADAVAILTAVAITAVGTDAYVPGAQVGCDLQAFSKWSFSSWYLSGLHVSQSVLEVKVAGANMYSPARHESTSLHEAWPVSS